MPIGGQNGWFERAHLLYWVKMLVICDEPTGMMNGKQMLWALKRPDISAGRLSCQVQNTSVVKKHRAR